MPEKRVGKVEHYYPKAKAAAVGLTDDLKVGDEIHIVGHGDDVRKKVTSMQMDHVPIQEGHAGEHIGVGLAQKVHEGDDVLLVSPGRSARPRAAKPKAARKAPSRSRKASKRKAPARKAARKPAKAKRAKKAGRKKAAKRKAPARKGKAKRAKPRRR